MDKRPFELILSLISEERRKVSKTISTYQRREFTEEFGLPEEFQKDGRRKHYSLMGQGGKVHVAKEIKKQLGI